MTRPYRPDECTVCHLVVIYDAPHCTWVHAANRLNACPGSHIDDHHMTATPSRQEWTRKP